MSHCSQLQPYLDESLQPDEQQTYLNHLSSCLLCTRAVKTWQSFQSATDLNFNEQTEWNDEDEDDLALFLNKNSPRPIRKTFPMGKLLTAGLTAAACATLAFYFFNGSKEQGFTEKQHQVLAPPKQLSQRSNLSEKKTNTPKENEPTTAVQQDEVLSQLAPSISRDNARKGAIIKTEHKKPVAQPIFDLTEAKKLVAGGDYAQATEILKKRLKSHSQDFDAAFLLADCYRKEGNFQHTLNTYQTIIESTAPHAIKNKARYRSAAILQDKMHNLKAAVDMLQEFIQHENAGGLKADAMVRLSECFHGMGQKKRAREILLEIIHNYSDLSAGLTAKKRLSEWGHEEQ